MVTKATSPVIDLSLPIDTFNLRGNGTSSIDGTPIGALTPSTGVFTNLTVNGALNVAAGTPITGLPIPITNAVLGGVAQPYDILNSSDGVPFVNDSATPIAISSGITASALTTDGLVKLSDHIKGSLPSAQVGVPVADKNIVTATDTGQQFINVSGAPVTPTGSTSTILTADGLIPLGTLISTLNSTYHPINAAVGTAVPNATIETSSDGILMINLSGAPITPTGTTSATLGTDGLMVLGSVVSTLYAEYHPTNAKAGTAVPVISIVTSSDGTLMINHTNAPITPTGVTEAALIADGLVPLGTLHKGSNLGGVISPNNVSVTYQNGTATSQTLASSNGVAPFTWSISSGALPAGVTLNPTTGVISGTPTGAPGTPYSYTVKMTDANGDYNLLGYTGVIEGSVITGGSITPSTVSITNGVTVNTTLVAAGGTAPYTYSVSAGALPAGLTLDPTTGILSGTPSGAPGTLFNFTIRATDSASNYTEQAYSGSILVNTPPATYPNKQIFTYTGADQSFAVPPTATWVKFKIWGAGGSTTVGWGTGGPGGFTQAEFSGLGGQTLLIVVGQNGIGQSAVSTYGGGGAGGPPNGQGTGGSGGGLSGVFTDTSFAAATPAGALAIAGGGAGDVGGGGGGVTHGAGGGLSGTQGAGATATDAKAGTQTAGGAAATVSTGTLATAGGQFFGGTGGNGNTPFEDGSGGGGSGWYGGGGAIGVGAGGSGYFKSTAVNGVTTAGNQATVLPPNQSDPDYAGNAGIGGVAGRIVIEWN